MIKIFKYRSRDIPICQSKRRNEETKLNQNIYSKRQATAKRNTMSNTSITIANAECTGVFCQQKYQATSHRYNVATNATTDLVFRNGIMGDYHLFLRSGDKVYIEVKSVGDVVISFAELQKNKYWKYYYDLSLLLANDKHKVIKNAVFNKDYDEIFEYTGSRVWSFETAYIDYNINQAYKDTYTIIPSGNVCYYKINPFDVEKMEYTSPQRIDLFKQTYMCRNELRYGYFRNRNGIYKNIAIEYQVSNMEKELDELSAFFEEKKHIMNITAIREKIDTNIDVLMIIYKNLIGDDNADNPEMVAKIDRAMEAKTALKLISQILAT